MQCWTAMMCSCKRHLSTANKSAARSRQNSRRCLCLLHLIFCVLLLFFSRLPQEEKKLEISRGVIEESAASRPSLLEQRAALETEKGTAEKKRDEIFERVRARTEGLRLEMEQKQKQLIPLRQDVNQCQQRLNTLRSERALYTDKLASASAQLSDTTSAIDALATQATEQQSRADECRTHLQEKKTRCTAAVAELRRTTEERCELEKRLSACRSTFEENKLALRSSRSRGSVLDALMQARQRGELPGIQVGISPTCRYCPAAHSHVRLAQGRLGDLGSIDQQYDVAISTACGALKNIVVDTVDTAQKCANYLR